MASRFDFAVAAPPDDGHQGSFTTPDQVMQVPAAARPEAGPPLASDASRTSGAGASPLMMLLAALAFAAVTALFIFVYA